MQAEGTRARPEGGFRGAWALQESAVSLERDVANHLGVCPGAGRYGGGMKERNRGGPGRERRVVLLALVVVFPDPMPRGSPVPCRCPW